MAKESIDKVWERIKKSIEADKVNIYLFSFCDPTEFLTEPGGEGGTEITEDDAVRYNIAGIVTRVDESTFTLLSLWQDRDQNKLFPQRERGMVIPKGAVKSIATLPLGEVLWEEE
ncbi:MAG: hypothetical protein J7L26_04730 [Candidatus Aminicenantes bacterium]|nr:hypothetical protein [Candidatus Aminicenantes bacterium]